MSYVNVKVLVGEFNQDKALVGAFFMIVKLESLRRFVSSSTKYVDIFRNTFIILFCFYNRASTMDMLVEGLARLDCE